MMMRKTKAPLAPGDMVIFGSSLLVVREVVGDMVTDAYGEQWPAEDCTRVWTDEEVDEMIDRLTDEIAYAVEAAIHEATEEDR